MKSIFNWFHPATLFVFSFLCLIALGSVLLLMPYATTEKISFIDALFTSTSAVCVTGLIVVDTSSCFTFLGQLTIMLLIQLGGLGILTFASYFSYFFKGSASYSTQLALGDISNVNRLGDVFNTLKKILLITLSIELFGAVLIYLSLRPALIPHVGERIFFSLFHSISSFCNAGFSTLPHGIMEEGFLYNYPFQLVLIFLLVFGGLGFPIVINILQYLKHLLRRLSGQFTSHKDLHKPWVLTLGSKINLVTIAILIIGGTLFILINEYDHVLAAHEGVGKLVTALFTATTPRTAGYNTINFNELHLSSILVIIFLMWIGASSASTGGGIKVSTFAVAILNFIALVQEKRDIEVYQRRISDSTIRRAFATITLSLLVIGVGISLIASFDPEVQLLNIVFECFSAYSTVGLSLGITDALSASSKLVLVGLMFTGRVTMLTILIALFRKQRFTNYTFPSDDILIN